MLFLLDLKEGRGGKKRRERGREEGKMESNEVGLPVGDSVKVKGEDLGGQQALIGIKGGNGAIERREGQGAGRK